MNDHPDWATDGRGWPNRAQSRFIEAGGLRWHVQVAGEGPAIVLLHGTGAATHSWAGMLPLLAERFEVIAPDLPGHGFTATPAAAGMSLPGMAGLVSALLGVMGVRPVLVAGHSAGAAVGVRMALDGAVAPAMLFSLNGALLPLHGMPMQVFTPLARLLSSNTVVPRLFAWHAADRAVVARLLANTGSAVPPESLEFYARLARRAGHAAGALTMMARWDLAPIARALPGLRTPLTMINGGNDRTIPPSEAARVRALLPSARLIELAGLGHLAHEEAPGLVAAPILAEAAPAALRRGAA